MKNKLLSGSFWLSAANLICKLLGIIYLIPWLAMMGTAQDQQQAQALYNVAYLPYALFLSLGTAGFPSAIAKQIALKKKENRDDESRGIFLSALSVMEVLGIVSGILMFVFAPLISQVSPVADHEAAVIAIRSLCPSLIIIPVLSALRGYFQGENRIIPFGVSQVIEQFVRVIVILGGTFYFRSLTQGSVLSAVVISTLASCIGGIVAIFYLIIKGKKENFLRLRDFTVLPHKALVNGRKAAIGIIKESLPFIYIGSVISLAQLIDQVTIKPILVSFTQLLTPTEAERLYTIASANPNKLTALLLAIISSITVTSLPLLSGAKTKKELAIGVSDTLRLSYTILLPASVGMLILAIPINTIFFGYDLTASGYLAATIVMTFVIGIFTILVSVLQALSCHKKAIQLTSEILIIKLVLQIPLVYLLQGYGIALSTGISFFIASVQAYRYLTKEFSIQPLAYVKNYLIKITGSVVVMALICVVFAFALRSLSLERFLSSAIFSFSIAGVGSISFILLAFPRQIKAGLRKITSR